MKTAFLFVFATCLVVASGCSSNSDSDAVPEATNGRTFEAQVADGMSLYGSRCATCHGDSGQGTGEGPPVVGDEALPRSPRDGQLRGVEFVTALDVFEWVSQNMPADDPGSLATEDYINVLAFALHANGVEPEEPLSAANATEIVLNP
jgi:cytochrome c